MDKYDPSEGEHIWVLVPLQQIEPEEGFTLMTASHRHLMNGNDDPYRPTILPGQALMFDARLRTKGPTVGGGVVFARAYDMTGLRTLVV